MLPSTSFIEITSSTVKKLSNLGNNLTLNFLTSNFEAFFHLFALNS